MRLTSEEHLKLVASAEALHSAAMVLVGRASPHDAEMVEFLRRKAVDFRNAVNRMRLVDGPPAS